MGKLLGRAFRKYRDDQNGHFALWTAVMALPMSLGISIVFDMQNLENQRTELKSALDSAALAAITHQTLTPSERAKYAKERFWLNLGKTSNTKVNVPISENYRVQIDGKIKVPTLMSSVIGKDFINIEASAETELTKGATVCMLALDPDASRSFEVTEGAVLDASTCSIQVNSIHPQASVVDLGGVAKAQQFCIAGGAVGDYAPYANTQCSLLKNPYENIEFAAPGSCVNETALAEVMAHWTSERDAVENHEILENQRWADAEAQGLQWWPTYFEKNTLSPGNYCNGLFLEGKEFILEPGVYHIQNGSLVFGLGTELIGEGVTFVLHENVDMEIRDGSILNIKAPIAGPYAGLVFAQDIGSKPIQSTLYPDTKSVITSGAMLNLLGTVYLPTHKIEFMGGSLAETRAPATSFISHQISIRDGADLEIAVDHISSGIPPIVPRSDDGARLVR